MSVTSLADTILADAVQSARIVETVVGNGWATDADGRFTYVTPATLVFLGLTLKELNSSTEPDALGWKRVIHPEDYDAAAAEWRRCLLTGDHYNVEHRMQRAAGVYGWSSCSGQPLRDREGRITGWYGTVIDTEVSSFASNRFEDAARDAEAISGAPPPLRSIHPADRPAVAQAAAYAFWTGVPQVMSFRRREPDGSYAWTEFRAEPGYGVSVDVQPMVSRPEERWTSASSFGETVEAVKAAKVIETLYGKAWAFDAGGNFTYVTPAAQTVIGMTLEDLNAPVRGGAFIDGGDVGWSLGVHPDDYEAAAAKFRHSLKTGEHWNVEYRMLRTTGQYVWHRIAARPTRDGQGRITGWFGTSIDIDVYKRTEEALREKEQRLQQLIDTVPAMIWSMTSEGAPSYLNKRFTEITGGTLEDVTWSDGSASLNLIHPDDNFAARQVIAGGIASGRAYTFRHRQRRRDGSYRWTETRAEPLRDDTGAILQWYGVSVDIHDMVVAKEALQERERFVWQLVETLPAMIDCAAPNGEPIYRSQQLREFLGYQLQDLEGVGRSRLAVTLEAGVHPDDLAGVKDSYALSLSTGEPYARRHRLRRFDGEYRWVETRAAAMRSAEGGIVQWNIICLDIDAEVRTQEELRLSQESLARASQAASLAELSASIAHEVNQPLAAVVANSHACERWLRAEPPNIERAQKTVERIIRDANSAADVVSRIRALFKQALEPRSAVAFDSVVAEARDLMAEEAVRRRIRLNIEVARNLPPVTLDRVQIQQVLVNLIRNGMEAMDATKAGRSIEIRARRLGDAIQTEISDHGVGVEFPDKVFEPFFTTKASGMGMGLAICRSIIESHGGRLWAEKNEPRGATFIFTLPVEAKVVA
jgi:PAS domain S-box-containing protein